MPDPRKLPIEDFYSQFENHHHYDQGDEHVKPKWHELAGVEPAHIPSALPEGMSVKDLQMHDPSSPGDSGETDDAQPQEE